MSKEALKLALEEIKELVNQYVQIHKHHSSAKTLTILEQALAAQPAPVQPVGIKGYAMALNEVSLQLRDRYKTDLLSTPLWAEFEKARNKFASSVATPPAAPTVQEPVAVVGEDKHGPFVDWLGDRPSFYERNPVGTKFYTTPPAQPAVPDAMTSADIQENIEYVAGWNDCRQAMLEMMK